MNKDPDTAVLVVRLFLLISGSVCIGLSLGWPAGVATFFLLPLITSSIKRAGTESK